MKLKYNLFEAGVMSGSFMKRDELFVKICNLISKQEDDLLRSQAGSSIKRFVVEIEKVFEDGDCF